MKTILEILCTSLAFLQARAPLVSRREVEEVIAYGLGMKRIDLYLQWDRPLTEEELVVLRPLLKRLAEQEPAAYIIGSVPFYGMTLKVTPAVLIPRPETEQLVDKIVRELKQEEVEGKVAWDLCCGSGCIGHALKKRFPTLSVVLSDLSELAIAVARENGTGVAFRQGDLFAPFEGEKCDFLVCNPPYVTEAEYALLTPAVKAEPKMALVGGTSFYERLAEALPCYLRRGGRAWLEIGADQGEAVAQIFGGKGRVEKDWSGRDRFFSLEQD